MAVRLLSSEVSDICIGKPAARWLPLSATILDAIIALKRSGENCFGVCSESGSKACGRRIGMVDIICYLCAEENVADPIAALHRPLAAVVTDDAGLFCRVEPHSSLIEALDLMLAGDQSLVVPLRSSICRQRVAGAGVTEYCWLTREDFVRFFLDSISLFSPIPYLTITELGLVRLDAPTVGDHEPALSALPLLSRVVSEQTSVAVVAGNSHRRRLIGEISHSALCCIDETAAAALAVLSAGEFASYIKCSGSLHSVKDRLEKKGMPGLLKLLESGISSGLLNSPSSSSSTSSTSSSASSSSSDEEVPSAAGLRRMRRTRRGKIAAGRRKWSKEVVVCHPESTLVAVILQALAHRLSYLWVVDVDEEEEDEEEDEEGDALVGVVSFSDLLRVFREQLGLMSPDGDRAS